MEHIRRTSHRWEEETSELSSWMKPSTFHLITTRKYYFITRKRPPGRESDEGLQPRGKLNFHPQLLIPGVGADFKKAIQVVPETGAV